MRGCKVYSIPALFVALVVTALFCACSDSGNGVTEPASGALPEMDHPHHVAGDCIDTTGGGLPPEDVYIEIWAEVPKSNPPTYGRYGYGWSQADGSYDIELWISNWYVDVFAWKEGFEDYAHYGLYVSNNLYTWHDIELVPE